MLELLFTKSNDSKSRVYALIGAIFWIQTGFHFNHTAHLNILNTVALLPLELLLIERRLINKNSAPKTIVLLSIVIALQIFAGHPQFASYCLMFLALYWLLNQVIINSSSRLKDFFFNALTLSLAILLGLTLSAVQLFPTLEFTLNSTRQSGLDEDAINFLSLRLQDLPTFIAPFYAFTFEPRSLVQLSQLGWPFDERYSYIGILPLVLVFISSFFLLKKRQAIIFLILGTFFLLLSLGNQSPIGILLKLPPLNLFRIPVKFTSFAQFSFVVLAVIGLKGVAEYSIKQKNSDGLSKKTKLLFALLIIISTIDTGEKLYKLYPIEKGEWWLEKPYTVNLYDEEIKKSDVNIINKPLELRVLGQDYNVQMHRQYLEQDPKLWNNLQPQMFKNNRAILPAFDMLSYDVPLLDNAVNSAGLKVKWYSDIESRLFFTRAGDADSEGYVDYSPQYWKYAYLTGAKYLLHNDNLKSDNVNLIGKTSYGTGQDQIGLYKFNKSLPFMQAPQNIIFVDDKNTFQEISKDSFNPDSDIIISDSLQSKFKIKHNNLPVSIYYSAITPELISARIQSTGPSIILIRQAYFPGWSATVNNNSSELFRANHAFSAIYIPSSGNYNIKLEYKPVTLLAGIYTSLSSLILCFSIMAFDFYRSRNGH